MCFGGFALRMSRSAIGQVMSFVSGQQDGDEASLTEYASRFLRQQGTTVTRKHLLPMQRQALLLILATLTASSAATAQAPPTPPAQTAPPAPPRNATGWAPTQSILPPGVWQPRERRRGRTVGGTSLDGPLPLALDSSGNAEARPYRWGSCLATPNGSSATRSVDGPEPSAGCLAARG